MKSLQIWTSIFFLVIIGCSQNKKQDNHFTSSSDTLIVRTRKIKGYGMLPGEGVNIEFQDTIENHDFHVVFPEGITNIKLAKELVDFKPFKFQYLKDEKSDYITTFLKDNFPKEIDTLNIPSLKDNSISINEAVFRRQEITFADTDGKLHRLPACSRSVMVFATPYRQFLRDMTITAHLHLRGLTCPNDRNEFLSTGSSIIWEGGQNTSSYDMTAGGTAIFHAIWPIKLFGKFLNLQGKNMWKI